MNIVNKPVLLGLALASALLSGPAHAAFHLMKIVEVFPGTAASPDAQYVVLQMYSGGQNSVGGHSIIVFDAAGNPLGTATFAGSVANGASQDKIFVGTSQAQSFFGIAPDLILSGTLSAAGGKVCFDTIDCFAWGNYSGSATGVGTPFNAVIGLQSGKAAIRRLDIAGSPTLLEAADDTGDSANDFLAGTPVPRDNAGVNGTIPPNTCPNMVIEGLEECDDGNIFNGDGCSSTCTIEFDAIFASGFE